MNKSVFRWISLKIQALIKTKWLPLACLHLQELQWGRLFLVLMMLNHGMHKERVLYWYAFHVSYPFSSFNLYLRTLSTFLLNHPASPMDYNGDGTPYYSGFSGLSLKKCTF